MGDMALTLAQIAEQGSDWPPPGGSLLERMMDAVPVRRRPLGKAWICETREHRYHRQKQAAQACAWAVLPMRTMVTLSTPMDVCVGYD